jgi:uncharacterized protein YndB with AHSA1/START domain
VSTIEQSVTVDLPVRTVYNQWTQFEQYPKFMTHVEAVKQLDDTHLHWTAKVLGARREWVAEITEQIPDQRIAWRAQEGNKHDGTHGGAVTFHRLDDDHTQVMLQLDMAPSGLGERVAVGAGVMETSAKKDLKAFKTFVENRGGETGAWRGDVDPGATPHLKGSPISVTDRTVANTGAYEEWTKEALYARAVELDVHGRGRMTKAGLIAALRSASG